MNVRRGGTLTDCPGSPASPGLPWNPCGPYRKTKSHDKNVNEQTNKQTKTSLENDRYFSVFFLNNTVHMK